MHRNYEMLTRLFGGDNVICYSVARPTLKIIVLSLLRMGCYGVSKRDEETIMDVYCKDSFDFVFFEGSLFGRIVKLLHGLEAKSVIFEHNVDASMAYQEYLYDHSLVSYVKYRFIKFNEKRTVRYATSLIALNKRDCDGFERMYGRKPELIFPITSPKVDLDDVPVLTAINRPFLLFVGADFYPNIEGIVWFIEHVSPFIQLDLRIVGACCNNPTFSVAELSLADDIISLNNDVSNPFVGFIKSTPTNPITAATKAVPKNTITILFSIFPNLCIPPPILAIADVTLKNTNGTNVMNNKFKNNSPIGFKTTAFSPIVAPTIPPSNIAPSNTIEDL